MKTINKNLNFDILRQKAEAIMKDSSDALSEADNLKLVHEWQVQKIELEMQAEELILAKEEADLAKEKYTNLFDFAPSGYLSLSCQGDIIDVNFSAANMLGKERLNLMNNKFGFFISNETRPVFNSFLERIITNKSKETCEVIISIESNAPVNAHIEGVFYQKSEQCFLTIVDITEQKQFEQATIECHRLNAIAEMASSIAHDFNNSLQLIIGNLEIAMLKFDLPRPSLKYFETIIKVVEDAAIRIQTIQRFKSKKQEKNQYSAVNLNTVAADVISQSQPLWIEQAERNGIKINIVTKFVMLPDISANGSELRIALYNIIKNSIEAMPKGGQIIIETGIRATNVFMKITDTGVGMDENIKTRIFQPFYTTKGFELGRGLGMSGTFTIIKEHQGSIQVTKSEVGKGTTVEILLPM